MHAKDVLHASADPVWLNVDDAESKQVHLNGVIIRDLSSVVSNYRSKLSLDEYLKKQNVRGIANVDTRAITRRLREAGNLNGVITSDTSKSDEELIEIAKSWNIVGKDLITDISINEPYEWKDPTVEEWEFSSAVKGRNGTEPLHVSARADHRCAWVIPECFKSILHGSCIVKSGFVGISGCSIFGMQALAHYIQVQVKTSFC